MCISPHKTKHRHFSSKPPLSTLDKGTITIQNVCYLTLNSTSGKPRSTLKGMQAATLRDVIVYVEYDRLGASRLNTSSNELSHSHQHLRNPQSYLRVKPYVGDVVHIQCDK